MSQSDKPHQSKLHNCNCLSRRQFAGGLAALTTLPLVSNFAIAEEAPVRTLAGALDIEGFKQQASGNTRFKLAAKDARTAFRIGKDAFLANEAFEAEFEVAETGVVAGLAIGAGQLLSVFEPISGRKTALDTPNASASIRGTGCFVDVETDKPQTYICCCYGEIAFQNSSTGEAQVLKNSYHNARFINPEGNFAKVPYSVPLNHYDDQLVALENAVGRKPHWQLPDGNMLFFAPTPLPF